MVLLAASTSRSGLIILAWLLGLWLDQPPLRTFLWDARDALLGVAATLPLLLLFVAMMWRPVGPLAGIKRFSEEVIRPLLAPCTLIDLIGISVLAGLGEEMLFRGVRLRWMTARKDHAPRAPGGGERAVRGPARHQSHTTPMLAALMAGLHRRRPCG